MKNSIKYKAGMRGMIYLVKSTSMSYFSPSGKARLGTKTTYHVYADLDINSSEPMESHRSRYNFKTKADALKYFNSL